MKGVQTRVVIAVVVTVVVPEMIVMRRDQQH